MQTTLEPPVRHTCTFCGGHSIGDLKTVVSPLRTRYRVPADHELCKQSILSLSLSMNPQTVSTATPLTQEQGQYD